LAGNKSWRDVFNIDANKVVKALGPYGPTPIVAVVTGLGAFAALSVGANPLAVFGIAGSVLLTQIWATERKAGLRKKELEVEFDYALRGNGKEILDKLTHRQRKLPKPTEPTLFNEDADE
jgi:hypothetical protein